MFVTADLGGSHYEILRSFMVYGSTSDITRGSLVMSGVADVSLGTVIPATSSAVDIVGPLTQLHDYSEVGTYTYNGDMSDKKVRPEADVDVRPFAILHAQVKICATQELTCTAGSTDVTLGTTVGATDVLGGCWVYKSDVNELRWVEDHDANDGFTLNTAATQAWTGTTKPHIVPQRLYGGKANQGLTPSADQVICEGDETVLWAAVVDHFVSFDGQNEPVRLNPGIHDGLNNLSGVKLWVDIVVRDHAFNSLS